MLVGIIYLAYTQAPVPEEAYIVACFRLMICLSLPGHAVWDLVLEPIGILVNLCTVEPPKKGHFGNGTFVLSSEVVLLSEVHEIF